MSVDIKRISTVHYGSDTASKPTTVPSSGSERRTLVGEADLPAVLVGDVGDLSYRQSVLAELLRRVDVQNAVLWLASSFTEQQRDPRQVLGLEVLSREETDTVQRDCWWTTERYSKKKSASKPSLGISNPALFQTRGA